jgi:class 3 adenylate cyclase
VHRKNRTPLKAMYIPKKFKIKISLSLLFLGIFSSFFFLIFGLFTLQINQTISWLTYLASQEISEGVHQNITLFLSDLESQTALITPFLEDKEVREDFLQNPILIESLKNMVSSSKHLNLMAVADSCGKWLLVKDLSLEKQKDEADLEKILPQNIDLGVQIGRPDQPTSWQFFDWEKKELVKTELEFQGKFDPRQESWYLEAQHYPQGFWTPTLNSKFFGQSGYTFIRPLKGKDGKIDFFILSNFQKIYLSQFLRDQYINDKLGLLVGVWDQENRIFASSQPFEIEELPKENFSKSFIGGREYFSSSYIESKLGFRVISFIPVELVYGSLRIFQWVISLICFLIFSLFFVLILILSKKISDPIKQLAQDLRKIEKLEFNQIHPIETMIIEIEKMYDAARSLDLALQGFSKYLPKKVIEYFLYKEKKFELGSEKRDLALLFTDVEHFSAIIEKTAPERLDKLLSEYMQLIVSEVESSGGTVDKFIGDGIMAFWGAPNQVTDPIGLACRSALAIQEKIHAFNKNLKAKGDPLFQTRIGIHFGNVSVGNFGTKSKLSYTALGDHVNNTARLKQANKLFGSEILVSSVIYEEKKGSFLFKHHGPIQIKGKEKPQNVYELLMEKMPYNPSFTRNLGL